MLSRTAEGLFWLGRYMERADNVARLLEAGRRLDTLAGKAGIGTNEWTAILIAAGCRATYPGDIEQVTAAQAMHHLVMDPANPSSLQACFAQARANARAQRGSITAGIWTAANEAWRETRDLPEKACKLRHVADTIGQVQQFTALFRGAVSATMLRDERFCFLSLGQSVERADATARLADVKYHVLMPADHPIGSSVDQIQWNNLLRAAGARSSYRWVYKAPVESRRVIDFLLLNASSPRSLRFCMDEAARELEHLHEGGAFSDQSLTQVRGLRDDLRKTDVDAIIAFGLHEYLTDMIVRSNNLAISIGSDFGFGPIIAPDVSDT
ncbi:alpha-E domain-containing protein [Shimia ponticola]|uniref:alpha-E domain-containing protein n=1 Tax=Shimia ponticola TaxID=2582893 RepID=UPI0011BD7A23|nr:alpha-E domain-containing protein [Shimia ponticola]